MEADRNHILSMDLTELIQKKVARGAVDVLRYLPQVEPIAVRGAPVLFPKVDGPSVIWFTDKISNLLQRLSIHVKNAPRLERLLVHVLDAKDLAKVFKNPQYRFLFEHPALKIAVIELNEAPDIDLYNSFYAPTDWDVHNDSEVNYAFEMDFDRKDEWLSQIRGVYGVIVAQHRSAVGMGSPTFDTFMGVENALANIPTMIRNPDVRSWRGILKGCPAFLVGAGPSVSSQLDFLRANQNRALIVAADTMLKPLLNSGIKPHILCSIERGKEIVELLKDPRDQSDIFLSAQAALDPECFEIFGGPSTIGPYGLEISKYYPFDRIRFGAGHSCMGLGMALPPHMGCDPIYLMGIDLCWNSDGASHMEKVSYLKQDDYLKFNSSMKEQGIKTKNSKGETAYTHKYWMLFRHEFEAWTKNCKSKIYNLSPRGLPLEGAEFKELSEVKTLSQDFDFSKRLKETFTYDRHEKAKAELEIFSESALEVSKSLRAIEDVLKNGSGEEILEKLKTLPCFKSVLKTIFQTDIFSLQTKEQRTSVELEIAERDLKEYPLRVADIFEKASVSTQNLLKQKDLRFY